MLTSVRLPSSVRVLRLTAFLTLSLLLRPTVSRSVCLGIKHLPGAYDQIFITVRRLRVCCRALSMTRRRVCRLQLLLALASAVIFGSESRGTRDHNLLSQIRDSPFRRLLRLAGLRWRYSTPPPLASGRDRERMDIYRFPVCYDGSNRESPNLLLNSVYRILNTCDSSGR
jgi:hypothetical protein